MNAADQAFLAELKRLLRCYGMKVEAAGPSSVKITWDCGESGTCIVNQQPFVLADAPGIALSVIGPIYGNAIPH